MVGQTVPYHLLDLEGQRQIRHHSQQVLLSVALAVLPRMLNQQSACYGGRHQSRVVCIMPILPCTDGEDRMSRTWFMAPSERQSYTSSSQAGKAWLVERRWMIASMAWGLSYILAIINALIS